MFGTPVGYIGAARRYPLVQLLALQQAEHHRDYDRVGFRLQLFAEGGMQVYAFEHQRNAFPSGAFYHRLDRQREQVGLAAVTLDQQGFRNLVVFTQLFGKGFPCVERGMVNNRHQAFRNHRAHNLAQHVGGLRVHDFEAVGERVRGRALAAAGGAADQEDQFAPAVDEVVPYQPAVGDGRPEFGGLAQVAINQHRHMPGLDNLYRLVGQVFEQHLHDDFRLARVHADGFQAVAELEA